jgi:hypothetical protein
MRVLNVDALHARHTRHPRSILGLPMLEPNSWLAETVTVLTLLTGEAAVCPYCSGVVSSPASVAIGLTPTGGMLQTAAIQRFWFP